MAAIEIEKQKIEQKAPILPHVLRMKNKVLSKFKLPLLGSKPQRSKKNKAKAKAKPKRARGRPESLSRTGLCNQAVAIARGRLVAVVNAVDARMPMPTAAPT